MKRIESILDRVINWFAGLSTALIAVSCIIVCVEIISRYFFNSPQDWVVETTEYLILWFTFLGAAWVLKMDGHVKIDIVLHGRSQKFRSLISAITSFICAAECFLIFWIGVQVCIDYYQRGIVIPKTLQPPKYPILAVIPLGSFLLFVQFLRITNKHIRLWRELFKKQEN